MLMVAIEVSLVGGDGVQEQGHLAAAGRRGQERIILGKRLDTRSPQPAAHPVGDQHALGVGNADPGHPVDQPAEPLEFLVSQFCGVHEHSRRSSRPGG